ncbi:FlgD immunoglobulin-like domain containing protein [Algibacillus agarilyticus]|uniref:FlgD immunoglobulin-like domain containing protein n=1 Tax=Algibacillus agarilyticus TaxID=2234133 RepID=UPI000DD0AA71|nr:FlgD immunoglobulin-like domain containing protein [Algibacillus agarilyticus]
MSDITNTNFSDSLRWEKNTLDSTNSDSDDNSGALTQQDFFSLLTTQLAAQDPTKPTDNDQMIAQMTQFTMADGISGLSTQFEEFTSAFNSFMSDTQAQQTSNKALQASSMVGREVLVASDSAALFQYSEEQFGMAGQLMFDQSVNSIKVTVRDESGKQVANLDLGAATEGPLNFMWDGKNANGEQMPAGIYQISASGIDANEGTKTTLTTGSFSTVDSVRFGNGNELTMNLRGLGSFNMDDIIEVAP